MTDAVKSLPYHNKVKLIKGYQNIDDIIRSILSTHEQHKADYDKISENFWTGTPEGTARKLFMYCKKNIPYKIEPDAKQTVRSPGAIVGMKSGDCKHYASFIQGVLDSLKRKGYPVNSWYRFASYKFDRKPPHHVFVVMRGTDGQEIWIDPVLKNFNERKMYWYHTDKHTNNSVSGIGALYSISGIGRRNRAERKAARQQRKTARKQKRQAKKTARKQKRVKRKDARRVKRGVRRQRRKEKGPVLKRIWSKVKKFAPPMVAARNAFLTLLKLNGFHLSTRMHEAMKANPANKQKLETLWKKLGGNPSALENNIRRGVNTWNKLHPNKRISGHDARDYMMDGLNKYGWNKKYKRFYCPGVGVIDFEGGPLDYMSGIGAEPVTAATLLVAALPVIKAISDALRGMGINPDNIQAEGEAATDEAMEEYYGPEEQPSQYDETNYDYDYPEQYSDYPEDDFAEDDYQDEAEYEDEIGLFNLGKKKKAIRQASNVRRPLIRLRPRQAGEQPALIHLRSKRAPLRVNKRPLIRLRPRQAGEQPALVNLRRRPLQQSPMLQPAAYKQMPVQRRNISPMARQVTRAMTQKAGPISRRNTTTLNEYGEPQTSRDSNGISDFFMNVKDFAARNRDEILLGLGGIAIVYFLPRILPPQKKRRR